MQVGPSHALLQALAQVQQGQIQQVQARATVQQPAATQAARQVSAAGPTPANAANPQRSSPLGRLLDIRV